MDKNKKKSPINISYGYNNNSLRELRIWNLLVIDSHGALFSREGSDETVAALLISQSILYKFHGNLPLAFQHQNVLG